MENINEEVLITDEDVQEEEYAPEVLESDETDWKAEAQKLKGIAKRRATKLAKLKEQIVKKTEAPVSPKPESEKKPIEKKSVEFDYGQKAFLNTEGIKTDEEREYLLTTMEKTGEELDVLIKDEFIQNKLKSIRDKKEVVEATPTGTKRGSSSAASDSVEYWIAKGELPTDPMLRRKVVNERIHLEKDGNKFASQSVVSNVNVR